MNTPIIICEDSFQVAWGKAIIALSQNHWELWNLVVHIRNPILYDENKQENLRQFALNHDDIVEPNKVAYTIFPYKLYKGGITTRERLYKGYWRYFKKTRKMEHSGWGTYFERMINYPAPNDYVDQLGTIIDNINNRTVNYCASHVIIIPVPNKDMRKIMGAPCLNYLTVQVENTGQNEKTINLLAVYRNHDFRARTYGNYYGLCKLLQYIATETHSNLGVLTCVSSHAEVPNNKHELLRIANQIIDN